MGVRGGDGTGALRDPGRGTPHRRQGTRRLVEALKTADIRWTVTGVEQVEGFVRDGHNTVTVQSAGPYGQAKPWMRLVNGEWKMEECDVRISPLAMEGTLAGKCLTI